MINAKEELISLIEKYEYRLHIKAAEIRYEDSMVAKYIDLKVKYSNEEMKKFLEELNLEYYDNHGSQNIFGRIWLIDGSWLERDQIQGVEMWVLKDSPQIPERLYL